MADRRPTVYFHLEMGVQWRPPPNDNTLPRNHQLTYVSKNARQRTQQAPRQLPPTNTNYLAQAPQPHHPQLQLQQQQQQQQPHPQYPYQWYYPPQQQDERPAHTQHAAPNHNAQHQHQQQARRTSRPEPRPAYGRGHSAPPPQSDNSWDASPEPMTASALPTRRKPSGSSRPQIWKDLPPTPAPAQFRLGHDDMPWSPSAYASGQDADSLLVSPESAAAPHQHPQPSHRSLDDRDKVRTTEMQSLATAMMTVDNGFEDQWWYQGPPRLVNIAGDLIAPAVLAERYHANSGHLVHHASGDIVSAQTGPSPAGTIADIVSPVSDFSGSGSSLGLRRSLTTRSEEIYLDR